ncbi:Hypothetical protein AJAP_42625 (plasmid) [Amycolatopsis japonica]|uniref:Uncharacterized protein n=1 Tax=Amycolatopsis japonica TaxID=208439 RepID=A0A075V4J0_9PSEU|nr:hypothetical protein [Amycolatopsis japonica]AIG81292.1 Hypothetical protein AJAP_42625 [Amycolatopsis japonica]
MPKYARRDSEIDSDKFQAIEARIVIPRFNLTRLLMTMHPRTILPGSKQKPLTDTDVRHAIDHAAKNLTLDPKHPIVEALDGPDSAIRDAALLLYAWIDTELIRLGVFGPDQHEWIGYHLAKRGLKLPEGVTAGRQ